MKRSFQSGFQKRKKKQELDRELIQLPKVVHYFSVTRCELNSDNASTSQQDSLTDSSKDNRPQDKECTLSSDYSDSDTSDNFHTRNSQALTQTDDQQVCMNSQDIGMWGNLSNDDVSILYWIKKGPLDIQHSEGPFEISKRVFKNQVRYCTKGLFHSTKANGDKYTRDWLIYSQATGCIYCFVCKLLSTSKSTFSQDGFNDWRNPIMIQMHENSEDHRNALLAYMTRRRGLTVESLLGNQMRKEEEYWRHVIQRVVAVVRTLAERSLAFRGSDEKFGSPYNGNFLGILELIAEFDPFLENHIKQYGNCGTGNTSYLSKTICDELIILMSEKVRKSILNDLRHAGYFSLSVDSTPDMSHIDQLTVIIRYVSPDDGLPIERFLTFLEQENHSGDYMANMVLDYLKECDVDFTKCRGQSYDNAANMSGRYNGMQQKILEINKYAVYIPCAGHSLNLVGRAAVDCCLDAVNFFGIVQLLYTFFSSSTKRWAVLISFLEPNSTVPKRLSDTRWEAHAKSTSAIYDGYESIIDALDHIHTDVNQKGDTRREAGILHEKMEELEFVFMLEFWNRLLCQFHRTSKALQDPKLSLHTCAKLYGSLEIFLHDMRENFDDIEQKSKDKLPDIDYKSVNKRKRKRKRQLNECQPPEANEALLPREEFRMNSFIPIISALETNLKQRALAYDKIANNFSFLIDLDASELQITENVNVLLKQYPDDVDGNLTGEIKHFHRYIKQNSSESESRDFNHQDLYQIIRKDKVDMVFPNVETILQIFLSLMVTNCSGERSFSKLKRIKNELRTTMLQEKLSALSIMCIKSDKLRQLTFNDIIEDFACQKVRRKNII